MVTLPFSLCVCFKVVQEYERAVIFRLGRLLAGGSRGPGIFFVLPCIESYQKVDLRTITLDVPPQEVLTKDSVTVSVDAVVYYRVSNATVSVANVENAHHSTMLQQPGASRLNVSKSKMPASPSNCRGLWPPKPRQRVRPEPRLLLQRANKKPRELSKRPRRSFPSRRRPSSSVTCRHSTPFRRRRTRPSFSLFLLT